MGGDSVAPQTPKRLRSRRKLYAVGCVPGVCSGCRIDEGRIQSRQSQYTEIVFEDTTGLNATSKEIALS